MTDDDKIHDVQDDVQQYVGAAFAELAGDPVSLETLVKTYKPPKPNNMTALVASRLVAHGQRVNSIEMTSHLIQDVLDHALSERGGRAFIRDENTGRWSLPAGVDITTVTYEDQPLIRPRKLPDLFNPETGAWRDGHRSFTTEDLKELRTSMETFGWLPHLPAIQDENEYVIVGRRRLAVAEELGIKPVVETVRFGEGQANDVKRAALALASNIGGEKISPTDRKKIAADLYYGSHWSMPKIAELLKVSANTISRDLRGLTDVKPPDPKRGGRPRKPDVDPKSEPIPASATATASDGADDQEEDEAGELIFFEDSEIERLQKNARREAAAAKPKTSIRYVSHFFNQLIEVQSHATVLEQLCTQKVYVKHMAELSRNERGQVEWALERIDRVATIMRGVSHSIPVQPPLPVPGLDPDLFEGH